MILFVSQIYKSAQVCDVSHYVLASLTPTARVWVMHVLRLGCNNSSLREHHRRSRNYHAECISLSVQ